MSGQLDKTEFVVTHGRQVFDRIHTKVQAECIPVGIYDWHERLPIHKCFDRDGRVSYTHSSLDQFPDHGKWMHQRYKYREGLTVSVIVVRHQRYVATSLTTDCCIQILPNPDAPLIAVYARLIENDQSSMGERVCVFRGRGYTPDVDGMYALGINIRDEDYEYYLDEEEVAEEFDVDVLSVSAAKATNLPEVIVGRDAEGNEQRVLAKPEPGRVIRVRKRK